MLELTLNREPAGYRPGEEITGKAFWNFGEPMERAELRLFWYTEGKGTRDLQEVETISFGSIHRKAEKEFRFLLPEGPYSFSGKLISLRWALELIAWPGTRTVRRDFTYSPSGGEILLHQSGKDEWVPL